MDPVDTSAETVTAEAVRVLMRTGARFAYRHGSSVTGMAGQARDIDIAAYFGGRDAPQAFEVLLPPGVDLLVLEHAPLEVAGRVATTGELLFEADPAARVRWEALTRKIYFDELPRMQRAHREFTAGVRRG